MAITRGGPSQPHDFLRRLQLQLASGIAARLCAYVLEVGLPFQYHQKFVCQLGGRERSDDVCGEDDTSCVYDVEARHAFHCDFDLDNAC